MNKTKTQRNEKGSPKGMQIILLTFIISSIVSAVILSSEAAAIGVMPAGKLIDYEPGKVYEFDLTVLNNDNRIMKVFIYSEGNFTENLNIAKQGLEFRADEKEKKTTIRFTTPSGLEPGVQTINIYVAELPGQSKSSEGNMIMATGTVVSQIRINVPYPGIYAKAAINAVSPKPGEPALFTVSVYNMGTQDILEAEAEIEIFSPTNEKLGSFKTDKKGISSNAEQKLVGTWEGTKNPGTYYAKGIVSYDGKKAMMEKVFEVGEKKLEVTNFKSEGYRLGGIVKIFMDLKNTWNQNVEQAYADIDVLDTNGNVVGNFKTITIPIKAYDTQTLESFWDTKGLETGRYDLRIKLLYDGKTSEQTETVYIDLNQLKFGEGIGAGLAVQKDEGGIGQYSLMIIVVIILIALNIFLFMYVRRNKKKPE